jgi:RNA polymerase sigma-70 factor (ECF subfamily)
VFPFVRSRTGTKEEALDVTQDVFIDFFEALPRFTFQSAAQLYAYVFVIAKRKLAKHYSASSRTKGQEEFDEEFMSPSEKPQDDAVVRHSLTQALKTLDERTHEIVILHHWSRYTFGEIAHMLDMTESAVRVAHHRALRQLRPQVENLKT